MNFVLKAALGAATGEDFECDGGDFDDFDGGGDDCDFDDGYGDEEDFYGGNEEVDDEQDEDRQDTEDEEDDDEPGDHQGKPLRVNLNFGKGDDDGPGGGYYGGGGAQQYGGYAFSRPSNEEEAFFDDFKPLVENSMVSLDENERTSVGLPPGWFDGGRGTSWCQLFVGNRFTNAGRKGNALLPSAVLDEAAGGAYVPSMYCKDILSIKEFQRRSGKITESVVNMKARKFHTEPVDLSALFRNCRAVHAGRRYFLDRSTGHFDASEALVGVVNNDDRAELVLTKDLLSELLAFVILHNRQGGYASCELARLRGEWYGVQNLQILGHEEGHAPVQESEKVKNLFKGGQRYVEEYTNARLIGCGRSGRMIGMYYPRGGLRTEQVQRIIPTCWEDAAGHKMTGQTLPIPCCDSSITVNANGGISCEEKMITLNLRKPLYNWTFETAAREKSKSACHALVKVEGGRSPRQGTHSVLSSLGAFPIASLDLNSHLRIDKALQESLADALVKLPERTDVLTVDFCDTGEKHKAGMKGNYPVYRIVPVIRIQDRWYDLMTLSPRPAMNEPPSNLRYLQLDRMKKFGAAPSSGRRTSRPVEQVFNAPPKTTTTYQVVSHTTTPSTMSSSLSSSGQGNHVQQPFVPPEMVTSVPAKPSYVVPAEAPRTDQHVISHTTTSQSGAVSSSMGHGTNGSAEIQQQSVPTAECGWTASVESPSRTPGASHSIASSSLSSGRGSPGRQQKGRHHYVPQVYVPPQSPTARCQRPERPEQHRVPPPVQTFEEPQFCVGLAPNSPPAEFGSAGAAVPPNVEQIDPTMSNEELARRLQAKWDDKEVSKREEPGPEINVEPAARTRKALPDVYIPFAHKPSPEPEIHCDQPPSPIVHQKHRRPNNLRPTHEPEMLDYDPPPMKPVVRPKQQRRQPDPIPVRSLPSGVAPQAVMIKSETSITNYPDGSVSKKKVMHFSDGSQRIEETVTGRRRPRQ